jgi:rhomboid protease GluP
VLHGSVVHLLFNMLALFSFGTFLERFLGWRRYALLFVASGLGGGIASALRPGETLSVGASGGIWGLMIAGAVLITFSRGRLPALVVARQRGRAWVPVAMNAVYSFQPGVDLFAHFGGGVVGGLLMGTGLLISGIPQVAGSNASHRPPRNESMALTLASVGLLLVLGASLVLALVTGHPWELGHAPAVKRVELTDARASLSLPFLAAGQQRVADSTWLFGSLMVDPIAVIVAVEPKPLTEGQAGDAEGTLEKSLESLAPELLEGFTLSSKNEVKHTADGRAYLVSEQQSADHRVARSYWLIDGDRLANVMVLINPGATASWVALADSTPFSLELHD